MRQAFARAGLWFFGALVVVSLFFNESINNKTDSDNEFWMVVIIAAFVTAGIVFFYTWNVLEQEERALRNKERQSALKKVDGKDAQ